MVAGLRNAGNARAVLGQHPSLHEADRVGDVRGVEADGTGTGAAVHPGIRCAHRDGSPGSCQRLPNPSMAPLAPVTVKTCVRVTARPASRVRTSEQSPRCHPRPGRRDTGDHDLAEPVVAKPGGVDEEPLERSRTDLGRLGDDQLGRVGRVQPVRGAERDLERRHLTAEEEDGIRTHVAVEVGGGQLAAVDQPRRCGAVTGLEVVREAAGVADATTAADDQIRPGVPVEVRTDRGPATQGVATSAGGGTASATWAGASIDPKSTRAPTRTSRTALIVLPSAHGAATLLPGRHRPPGQGDVRTDLRGPASTQLSRGLRREPRAPL